MQKAVLDNGLKVIFEKNNTNSVVIELMVKTGSNHENEDEMGISHFIEHMLFEGTKKRPNNWLISNEIEKIGGEFNAYTTNERTCFYIRVLKKHFNVAINVLSDILCNSLFNEKDIAREKNVVIKEIDLVNDEPRYYQWNLLQKTIFDKHPSKNPVYGKKKVIKNLTREKILNYFNKNYISTNMTLSIVGDIKNWKNEIKNHFILTKNPKIKEKRFSEPKAKKINIKKKKKILPVPIPSLVLKQYPEVILIVMC